MNRTTVTLYVNDELPAVAAAILRERAMLKLRGEVYVKAPLARRHFQGPALHPPRRVCASPAHHGARVKNTPTRRKNLLGFNP